ncbi:MAG: glycosyltransferase family 4 protein [Candidatus Buchananbacteria bacterium]|nr:glycosyltransferase family 4 protein [Candidatus Buchananbacteria bacterium]
MKLLIITQVVDRRDPVLGFMHRWLQEFSTHFEQLTVICLKQGDYDLPSNVQVFSLGKEVGESRFKYVSKLFKYLWQRHRQYDTVFVHMNQEYVLLAGWWWRLTGKRVYMWRNHPVGNWLTWLAGYFCHRVFCTSPQSFTAQFPNTKLMPAGIDTDYFSPDPQLQRSATMVLSIGRISPAKDLETLIKAIALVHSALPVTAMIIGDPLPEHQSYADSLRQLVTELNLNEFVSFQAGIANTETVKWYSQAAIFINMSRPGFFDKTIFEAMACECPVIVSNIALKGVIDDRCIFEYHDVEDLAQKIKGLLTLPVAERSQLGQELRTYVHQNHSLKQLAQGLVENLK